MAAKTKIEWTRGDDGTPGRTWNPVRGCSIISPGCKNCYAMRQAYRFSGPGQPYEGLTTAPNGVPRWTGKIRLVPEALDEPLHWRKPARVFVNSMSDLFHEDVPDAFIVAIWDVMRRSERHTFQILTKRPARMRDFCSRLYSFKSGHPYLSGFHGPTPLPPATHMVLPNVWLGVSAENQQTADERIPILLQTPAAVRGVSLEPLLEKVNVGKWLYGGCQHCNYTGFLDSEVAGMIQCACCVSHLRDESYANPNWVIVGGESGPNARPCNLDWIRSIVEQCKAAGTPCFVKQLGSYSTIDSSAWRMTSPTPILDGSQRRFKHRQDGNLLKLRDRKGADPAEWPAWARVREYPR